MISEEQVHEALMKIVEHQEEKALNWAVNYAKAGLSMSDEELRVQVLYTIGNISHWRGEVAKEVRQILKDYIKERSRRRMRLRRVR